jgi:hypothetical protein
MRNSGLESELEDPHAPVDLGLLPEGEGVEVYEDVGGAAEGGAEGGLGGGGAEGKGDVGEGGEDDGVRGGGGAG